MPSVAAVEIAVRGCFLVRVAEIPVLFNVVLKQSARSTGAPRSKSVEGVPQSLRAVAVGCSVFS